MTILCVDDHPVIVKGLKNSVKQIYPEATILTFTVAKDALSYAQSHGCDVLICEIELYNHGGITLAEQIRNINPCVNIIFVTVCSEQEHAKEVLKLRPSGYLTKPIIESQLVAELQQLRYPVAY
jgi:DNA-binding NarL/FixJ family response regulator